jgi:hypothetical protein
MFCKYFAPPERKYTASEMRNIYRKQQQIKKKAPAGRNMKQHFK